jgi:hypothetical protein
MPGVTNTDLGIDLIVYFMKCGSCGYSWEDEYPPWVRDEDASNVCCPRCDEPRPHMLDTVACSLNGDIYMWREEDDSPIRVREQARRPPQRSA